MARIWPWLGKRYVSANLHDPRVLHLQVSRKRYSRRHFNMETPTTSLANASGPIPVADTNGAAMDPQDVEMKEETPAEVSVNTITSTSLLFKWPEFVLTPRSRLSSPQPQSQRASLHQYHNHRAVLSHQHALQPHPHRLHSPTLTVVRREFILIKTSPRIC